MYIFVVIIIACFVFMHTVELIASHARFSGKVSGRNATGYALQNVTFTMTRFLNILLMPLLGYLIDIGISENLYVTAVLSSLLGAALMGGVVFLIRNKIVNYYLNVIKLFNAGEGVLVSMAKSLFYKQDSYNYSVKYILNKRFFILGAFIYTLYSIGVFSSYLVALKYPDYRLTISQLSGVINALATILLTVKLDPMLSKEFDKEDSDGTEFFSVLLGRIMGVLFLAPILFLIIYIVA